MWTVAAVALVIGAGAAGWKWYPSKRNDPAAFSLTSRLEMSRAGVRMALTQPVFGVGIGRYYVLSSQFADPKLLAYMWRPHENAHNYFVQVLAEMGFPGLLLFGTLIVLTLNQAAGAQPRAPGLFAGLIVFLLTCCAGHPLLTPQVAYPFWIAMGLAAAPFGEARPLRNGWRALAGAALVFLAVTVPLRARDAVRHANLAATTMGLSLWNWHDQVRFRWAGTRSTQFFSSAARTIRIPLQCGPDAPSDLEIRLFIDNHEADRVHLPADGRWHDVRFVLGAPGETDFRRFDVEVRSADGRPLDTASTQLLMVGEPSIVWGQ
jgi:hypothetical protein